MTTHDKMHCGFTLKELFAVMFIIAALLFLLLPVGRRCAREAARRMQCRNNMKQLVLATHNYHDTHGRFPMAVGGTGMGGNENRRSGLVALLPFLEQTDIYDQITDPAGYQGFPPEGPPPWDRQYGPWQQDIQAFVCPSAIYDGEDYQPTNYAFCIGDVARDIHQLPKPRGAFAPGLATMFADITDGMSNTSALAEVGTASGREVQGQYAVDLPETILSDPGICWRTVDDGKQYYLEKVGLHEHGRGYNWADGGAGPGLVNTILPPNSPTCAVGGKEAVDGVYSAGSRHPGGCHVALCDGSVSFVTEKIDAGDSATSPPTAEDFAEKQLASPFGAWGAYGTLAGGEDVFDFRIQP